MNVLLRLTLVTGLVLLSACTSRPSSIYVDPRPQAIVVPPPAQQQQAQPVRQTEARPPTQAPYLPPRQVPTQQALTPLPQPVYNADPLDASVYRLGSGDVVRIDVLGESELSLEALIDPSGTINYPFLGAVRAADVTVRDLELKIRNGLRAGYLVNPDVRVGLARYRPVFISGQVRSPGSYPYSLGLNVEKAITLAGGLAPFGSTSRVYRQRNGTADGDRTKVSLDSAVLPGDYIIVEERLF